MARGQHDVRHTGRGEFRAGVISWEMVAFMEGSETFPWRTFGGVFKRLDSSQVPSHGCPWGGLRGRGKGGREGKDGGSLLL